MRGPTYLGVFLTPESRKSLLDLFPPKYADVHADHVTLAFKPDDLLLLNAAIGMPVVLRVVGHAHDEKVQAAAIGGIISENKHAHITISVDKERGGRAFDSNDMLEIAALTGRFQPCSSPIYLYGTIDTFPSSNVVQPYLRRFQNG